MWQTMERKAKFIAQVMRGRLDMREMEDIGDAALSYNEVKALATGNPLLLEKAEAEVAPTRLERAEHAFAATRTPLRHRVTQAGRRTPPSPPSPTTSAPRSPCAGTPAGTPSP